MKTNLNTIIGVTSLAASLLGMYYLVKKNSNKPQINSNDNPQTHPAPEYNIQDLIGRTVLAKNNNTTLFHVENRGDYWEKAETIRLIANKNQELGTVIAIVNDGFTTDTYAVIDIPFYTGSILNKGHGFVNTNKIKQL